jgi:hypothetical protein
MDWVLYLSAEQEPCGRVGTHTLILTGERELGASVDAHCAKLGACSRWRWGRFGGHPCIIGYFGAHLCNVADKCRAERLTSFSELNMLEPPNSLEQYARCSDQVVVIKWKGGMMNQNLAAAP